MNKTQLKKINTAKKWFKKSSTFTLEYSLKNFGTMRDKNNIIEAYEYLEKSFKRHDNFKDIVKFYNSKNIFGDNDYLKLCRLLKKFTKSFNLRGEGLAERVGGKGWQDGDASKLSWSY